MKRYIIECLGTFFLTLAISLTGNPIAIGLMLMIMIYLGGHISGGHFNPAVSLTMFLEKQLTSHALVRYWLAQSIGACVALHLFMMITNNMFIPEMTSDSSALLGMLIEGLFTMIFCWLIANICLTRPYKDAPLSGIVIGLTLMGIAFIGGLFNPAVAVGSLICNLVKNGVMADIPTIAVYIVSPLLGGLSASFLFHYFNSGE